MEKVYIIRWFDVRNWKEVISICFPTEPEAIDYCLSNTNFEAGVVCSYQEIKIGKQDVKQEVKDKISDDLSKKLLKEIKPKKTTPKKSIDDITDIDEI